jgi:hypothetical protein
VLQSISVYPPYSLHTVLLKVEAYALAEGGTVAFAVRQPADVFAVEAGMHPRATLEQNSHRTV